MIRHAVVLSFTLLLAGACATPPRSALYPEVEPAATGFLRVDDLHEIYWETLGNPDGIPVIVLHGGPGGGVTPEMRRFFDPARFFVVLFDQRGANRSRPSGEWDRNTTQLLVKDINLLRAHLSISRPAMLFGGGWGSALALAYAEAYPERVSGMVLRGVFLGTEIEIDHLYHGGAGVSFPDHWQRLRDVIPEPEVPDYPRQLFEMISGDDPKEREAAIEGWAYYETRMSSIDMTDERTEDILERDRERLLPRSILGNYYMMNGCFLPDQQLMKHVDRIVHIPTFIVHGRFDALCRPASAWELAGKLDRVELVYTNAGHSQGHAENTTALMRGVEWVAERILEDPGSGHEVQSVEDR